MIASSSFRKALVLSVMLATIAAATVIAQPTVLGVLLELNLRGNRVVTTAGTAVVTLQNVTHTVIGRDTTDTLTNKTVDVEGTGNQVTIPMKLWLPAAYCQNVTALSTWSTPTSNPATFTCNTGSNTQKATADFADAGTVNSMQTSIWLSADWSGAIDVKLRWFTSATSGNAVWQVATTCVADAETSDPAFNTASTVTDAAKGTTLQDNDATITGLTTTGCAAGELMYLQVLRDPAHASDTLGATASLRGVEVTYRRAM